jgi:hypothetical protein
MEFEDVGHPNPNPANIGRASSMSGPVYMYTEHYIQCIVHLYPDDSSCHATSEIVGDWMYMYNEVAVLFR